MSGHVIPSWIDGASWTVAEVVQRAAASEFYREEAGLGRVAVAAVLELHKPVHPVHSWQHGGLQYHDPCETCYGRAGVHECGCWADEDTVYECRECITVAGGRRSDVVPYPCPTVRAMTYAIGAKEARS